MSVIKVTLPLGEIPVEGKPVSFKAPCPCDVTEAIQIEGENYIVCDALGECVTGSGGVWDVGSIVTVTLSVEQKRAYIQNSAKHRVAFGSYVGTGTYGETNPNTLTFNFPPKVIMFHGKMRDAKNTTGNYPLFALCDSGSYMCSIGNNTNTYGVMSVSGNTVSWYTTNTYDANYEEYAPLVPYSQMNGAGETYYYVAIG